MMKPLRRPRPDWERLAHFVESEMAKKDDDKLADQIAAAYVESHATLSAIPGGLESAAAGIGPLGGRLSEAIKRLRASGIPWAKILPLIPQIVVIILTGGGDWAVIISKIMQLFFPPNPPTPAPQPTPAP
jgi:hypothetical protein